MPSTKLADLSSPFRPFAVELLAALVEADIPVKIICTLRTLDEHAANLANGTSKTKLSKHLPRSLRGYPDGLNAGKSDAIDLCPWEQFHLHGPDKLQWDASDPVWARIGEIGKAIAAKMSLGIRWGGDWTDPHDPGHFELRGI